MFLDFKNLMCIVIDHITITLVSAGIVALGLQLIICFCIWYFSLLITNIHWPCFCFVHYYFFIVVKVCDLLCWSKYLHACYCLFMYARPPTGDTFISGSGFGSPLYIKPITNQDLYSQPLPFPCYRFYCLHCRPSLLDLLLWSIMYKSLQK